MQPEPLVSIVTPSFNQSVYLRQTMLSVLEQDYPNIEYLVADGGSADGSLEIIKEFEPRLAWWCSEKDQGQADAINKGLRRSRGEIVAWLNSDDLYLPGVIREAVDTFARHPGASMVHGDVFAINEKGRIINRIRYGNWGLTGLMCFRIIGQPAVFMRREALEKAGDLDLDYHFLLDHHLWLRVGQEGDIIYKPEPWAKARFHAEAKNVARASDFGCEALRIVNWMRTQDGLRELFIRDEKKILAGAYLFNGRYLLDGDMPLKALQSYMKSLRYHPQTALREWHRILFCFPAMLGLGKLKSAFREWQGYNQNHSDCG